MIAPRVKRKIFTKKVLVAVTPFERVMRALAIVGDFCCLYEAVPAGRDIG
jgi:hypothetical protein